MTPLSDPKDKIGGDSDNTRENLRKSLHELADDVLKSLPPGVVEHMGNAAKELLLATRHLLDTQIGRVEKTVHRSQELHRNPAPPSPEPTSATTD